LKIKEHLYNDLAKVLRNYFLQVAGFTGAVSNIKVERQQICPKRKCFSMGTPQSQKFSFLGFSEASRASFSEASARSCANQLMMNKWCEALSSISWFRGARRAKIQVPTFHMTLRF